MEPAASSIKYVDMDVCLSGRVVPRNEVQVPGGNHQVLFDGCSG